MKLLAGIFCVALASLLWLGAIAAMMSDPQYDMNTNEYKALIASNKRRAIASVLTGVGSVAVGAMLIGKHLSRQDSTRSQERG